MTMLFSLKGKVKTTQKANLAYDAEWSDYIILVNLVDVCYPSSLTWESIWLSNVPRLS